MCCSIQFSGFQERKNTRSYFFIRNTIIRHPLLGVVHYFLDGGWVLVGWSFDIIMCCDVVGDGFLPPPPPPRAARLCVRVRLLFCVFFRCALSVEAPQIPCSMCTGGCTSLAPPLPLPTHPIFFCRTYICFGMYVPWYNTSEVYTIYYVHGTPSHPIFFLSYVCT